MKTLLLALLIFAPIMNQQACWKCGEHSQTIDTPTKIVLGETVPKGLRAVRQDWYHGCRMYKTLYYIYKGRHELEVIEVSI